VGIGYDLTNEIFYEETFDSTALTGRKLVSDAAGRVVALNLLTLAAARGPATLAVANDLRAGPRLVRDLSQLSARRKLGGGFELQLGGDHDFRRDRTFDAVREDHRLGLVTAARFATPDLAWSARLFSRLDRERAASRSLRL